LTDSETAVSQPAINEISHGKAQGK
jgi:hypothetical protein